MLVIVSVGGKVIGGMDEVAPFMAYYNERCFTLARLLSHFLLTVCRFWCDILKSVMVYVGQEVLNPMPCSYQDIKKELSFRLERF
jgi:hypothetical protein